MAELKLGSVKDTQGNRLDITYAIVGYVEVSQGLFDEVLGREWGYGESNVCINVEDTKLALEGEKAASSKFPEGSEDLLRLVTHAEKQGAGDLVLYVG